MIKGLWWLVGIILIIVIVGGGYAIFHNSDNANPYSNSSSNNNTSNSQSSSGKIIQTKTDSKIGQYLADANGMALYTYGADSAGVSNCSGSCLSNWPVYKASASTGTLPANVTVITRSDGTKQYAYNGMPLYTFTGDSTGQVTGDGVENFHIAKPASSSPSTSTPPSDNSSGNSNPY